MNLTNKPKKYTLGILIPLVKAMNQEQTQKQIHIKLNASLHQALKLEAALCNQTIQELVVELIKQRISRSEFSGFLNEDE